jgi:hypothetical protein
MNMEDFKLQPDMRKRQVRGFWALFFIGIVLVPASLAEILAPFFIDGLCGHIWGSLAAVANIAGWTYYGLRIPVAPSTRLILLVPFAFVVLVAVVEFAHLFHWQINSNGHF